MLHKNNIDLSVVAGVVSNSLAQILITRRPLHLDQGGLWEFPGGKIEPGESAQHALIREFKEELDLTIQQARPLIRITHPYPNYRVSLDVWRVEQWTGQPKGLEGQAIAWCPIGKLRDSDFPAANYPVITALELPSEYLITPNITHPTEEAFFQQLQYCLQSGISLVQLRAPNLSDEDYDLCTRHVKQLCQRYEAKLLLNSTPEKAIVLETAGVHLNNQRLFSYKKRPLPKNYWVAASCHNQAEIEQANILEVDFIVLSPVYPTLSHPGIPPLGWSQFFELTRLAQCPVFALGGLNRADIPTAWQYGAQGIAAIRGLWDCHNN